MVSKVIAVRITPKEGKALDAMVAAQNDKLRRLGFTPVVSAASFCRSLVLRAAVEAGLLPPLTEEPAAKAEVKDVELVVLPPGRRPDASKGPLPPATRFDRVLGRDTFKNTGTKKKATPKAGAKTRHR